MKLWLLGFVPPDQMGPVNDFIPLSFLVNLTWAFFSLPTIYVSTVHPSRVVEITELSETDNALRTLGSMRKAQQKIMPIVLLSLVFFGFAIYGVVTFVKDMVVLFSK